MRDEKTPSPSAFVKVMKLTWIQLATLATILSGIIILWLVLNEYLEFLKSYPNKQLMAGLFLFMTIGVFFGVSNFMLGTAGLNNLSSKKYYAKALILTGVVAVSACVIMTSVWGVYGAAISFVLGELTLFFLIAIKYLKE
ncbi:hypothetical protein M5C90_28390 [Pseudomonas chlororaphis subsp. piscium]|nr:hypothetical protein M5C90_28390 [Pseudomonas chlororaphis subsp. piscium]